MKEFKTMTGEEIMNTPLPQTNFVVSELLPTGVHILGGAPKIGKSWLMLWMCLQISKGEKVWEYDTRKGTVLYLCLEDSYTRIQNRLFEISDDAPDNLHFSVMAENVENGLAEQIEAFVSQHEDTNLIVIDTLQNIRMDEQDMFSGMVYCKDCGAKMVLHRASTMKKSDYNFACRTYKKKGKEVCTAHFIKEDQLAKIILDDLRRVTHYARQHELMFAEVVAKKNSKETGKEITLLTKEIATLKRRDDELTKLFKRLYEDNVLGKIPNEVFRKLSDDYLAEQKEIQSTIPLKESKLEKLKDSVANVTAFIEEAKEITEINELTATILHRFIDKIVVGERTEKYSRTALQEIHIHYRYIGLLDDVIHETATNEQQEVA